MFTAVDLSSQYSVKKRGDLQAGRSFLHKSVGFRVHRILCVTMALTESVQLGSALLCSYVTQVSWIKNVKALKTVSRFL